MPLLSKKSGLLRTTGFYGHLPLPGYVGYLRLVTQRYFYTLWYQGNPYRHKIFERTERPRARR